ncbi:MAG: hypothetical protein ACO3QM_01240, partial [Candidatus Nanopelagicaceae bacterium]
GAQGPAGTTGATGATGPSNVQVVSIPSFTLQTSTAGTSSMSEYFGNLTAGASYKIEIVLRAQADRYLSNIGLTLLASGSGNSPSYNYVTSAVDEYNGGAFWSGNQFLIIGTMTVSASGSSLAVNLIDGRGSTSSGMTVTGSAYITLVGSITG